MATNVPFLEFTLSQSFPCGLECMIVFLIFCLKIKKGRSQKFRARCDRPRVSAGPLVCCLAAVGTERSAAGPILEVNPAFK